MRPLFNFLLFLLMVVLVLQLPFFTHQLEGMARPYTFISSDGRFEFVEIESKGKTIQMMEHQFAVYKERVNNGNLELFRETKINPLKIWLWREYLYHPRWSYPYAVLKQENE